MKYIEDHPSEIGSSRKIIEKDVKDNASIATSFPSSSSIKIGSSKKEQLMIRTNT